MKIATFMIEEFQQDPEFSHYRPSGDKSAIERMWMNEYSGGPVTK